MVQVIKTPKGEELAILPRADYERMVEELEAREHATAVAAVQAGALGTITDEEMREYLAAPTPLAFWRKKRDLTQRALADEIGISQSFLAEIERGKKIGEPLLYKRLAQVLRLRMEDLVVDSSTKPR